MIPKSTNNGGKNSMKKLILALLVAGLLVGSAMAGGYGGCKDGKCTSLKGFYWDWKHVGSAWQPVDALSICAKADADANSWNTKDETLAVTSNFGKFEVNSKDDPIIGKFEGSSTSLVAGEIKVKDDDSLKFENIQSMATASNTANMEVYGSQLAVLDIKSDVDTNAYSGWGNSAESSSKLDLKALAIGNFNFCDGCGGDA
jgi:hypothetical protein